MRIRRALAVTTLAVLASSLSAKPASHFEIAVLVDGVEHAEYEHRGTTYIEAVRGREFSLRLTNPTSHRVAVALAVDGLNTIDAKHTDGWNASKWVLDPYETTVISGWQVSDRAARRFVFTGERGSYGAAIGKTENLGVIEAIFYREQVVHPRYFGHGTMERGEAPPSAAAESSSPRQKALEDDHAATGMGDRTRHEVTAVDLVLERQPVASMRIRYEFRPQLVRLGVLPARSSALDRRARARGFEAYCPEPE